MKKVVISMVALSLVVGMTGVTPQIAMAHDNKKGIISVNTNANTEVPPDVAEIAFTVKTSDSKSIQTATKTNKEILEKVYSILNSMIDTQKGDYIKTADFSANPVYSYVNSKKVFERYEVSNRIIIHTKSIDKIGQMIDKAINAGATNVDNLTFSVSDYDSQCNDLITVATKKAIKRANVIASALSTSIEGISNISTSCSANNNNAPRLYMAKNLIADVAAESYATGDATTISNGVIKINANVNANFFVK